MGRFITQEQVNAVENMLIDKVPYVKISEYIGISKDVVYNIRDGKHKVINYKYKDNEFPPELLQEWDDTCKKIRSSAK